MLLNLADCFVLDLIICIRKWYWFVIFFPMSSSRFGIRVYWLSRSGKCSTLCWFSEKFKKNFCSSSNVRQNSPLKSFGPGIFFVAWFLIFSLHTGLWYFQFLYSQFCCFVCFEEFVYFIWVIQIVGVYLFIAFSHKLILGGMSVGHDLYFCFVLYIFSFSKSKEVCQLFNLFKWWTLGFTESIFLSLS